MGAFHMGAFHMGALAAPPYASNDRTSSTPRHPPGRRAKPGPDRKPGRPAHDRAQNVHNRTGSLCALSRLPHDGDLPRHLRAAGRQAQEVDAAREPVGLQLDLLSPLVVDLESTHLPA